MNCWLLRPYPHLINRMTSFLENNIIAIGWPGIGDLSHCDRQLVQQRLLDKYGEVKASSVKTIIQFKDDILIGDIILMVPKVKDSSKIALCRVISNYFFNAEYDDYKVGYSHQRRVTLLETECSRQELPLPKKDLNFRGTLRRLTDKKSDSVIRFLMAKSHDLNQESLSPIAEPIQASNAMEVVSPAGFRLEVKNYRGIEAVELDPNEVCLIVGPNGVGKTTLLKSLTLLCNTFKQGFGNALQKDGGAKGFQHFKFLGAPTLFAIEIDGLRWEISPGINGTDVMYPFPERLKQNGHFLFKNQPNSSLFEYKYTQYSADETTVALRRICESERYQSEFDKFIQPLKHYRYYHDYQLMELRRAGSAANSGMTLDSHGLNAFAVLKEWKTSKPFFERYEFVVDILQEAFPEFVGELSFPSAGQTVSLEVYLPNSDFPIPIHQISNGFLGMLLHLMAVCSVPDNGIVAIDEPENGLHPYGIKVLIEAFRERATEHHLTILLATHSPFILNQFKTEAHQVYVMEQNKSKQLYRLDNLKDPNWLQHFKLGNLYGREFGRQGD